MLSLCDNQTNKLHLPSSWQVTRHVLFIAQSVFSKKFNTFIVFVTQSKMNGFIQLGKIYLFYL